MKNSFYNKIVLLVIFLFNVNSYNAQDINIIPQLKKIEAGKIKEAQRDLITLKKENSGNPNVIFLEAVLTEDGEKSQKLYKMIYKNFPDCRFADAALFRSFSFYYALGLYKKAEELKLQLKSEFPKSAYLKNTDRNFPEIDDMIIVDSTPYEIKSQLSNQFTVQVGAFSNYKNATDLKSKFIKDGFHSKIKSKTVNSIRLHIVTVGIFNTQSEATNFLSILQSKYSVKGRVKPFE